MTHDNEERRPAGNGTALEYRLTTHEQDTPRGTESPDDTRARCLACSHPLTSPRSVARAYGPVCWHRTARGQLDARRDATGRTLGRLARRVASLDVHGLALVCAALDDAVDALDAAGGAR